MSPVLAIGPANFAGQAYGWATALNRFSTVRAFAFSNRSFPGTGSSKQGLVIPAHYSVPHHRASSTVGKRLRMKRMLRPVTHLAIDGFLSVYGRQDRSHVGFEIEALRRQVVELALIAHGSDVRDPDRHSQRYGHSYYSEAPGDWVARLRSISERNRSIAQDFAGTVFVSTPDLLLDVPTATWLPVCIDVESWRSLEPPLERRIPTVLHLPSRRSPPIKGTSYIDPVLRKLAEAGRIKYVSPNSVPHASMKSLVLNADILVDQIQSGSYGVAAVEGMAAGRVVIGYVGDDVVELMQERPPIIDAPPDRFTDVLDEILEEPGRFAEAAVAGPGFASRWHNGERSARVLTRLVQDRRWSDAAADQVPR